MNILKEAIDELGESWNAFLALMSDTLKSDVSLINSINAYLLENSGKKIRPVMTLLLSGAMDFYDRDSIRCAAVVEMLHTATLLHDDVADNSPLRRGAPTVMSMFSSASSVLAGDYWLSKSLELLTEIKERKVMLEFTKAVQKLAEGEMFQMEKAEIMDTSEEDYFRIIDCKTASLFVAPMKSIAIMSGRGDRYIAAAEIYASKVGTAFQIQDDIFDYSPEYRTGKKSGTDIKEHKITLPLIGALKNNPAGREQIMSLFREEKDNERLVRAVTSFVNENGGIEYAKGILDSLVRDAADSISVLDASVFRQRLIDIAMYLKDRKS